MLATAAVTDGKGKQPATPHVAPHDRGPWEIRPMVLAMPSDGLWGR